MTIFLKAKWQNIIMANYIVPKELLLPYLPKGLQLDLFEGSAYVSLVGFMFKNTRLFNIPIPYFGTFEEVNLRFYVVRKDGNELKRGVVFINETVPYKIVAWLANKLYNENYTAVKTKHTWDVNNNSKKIDYQWKVKNIWNNIFVETEIESKNIKKGSCEEFIFEHFYGYAKIDEVNTEEYKINHPSWKINTVKKSIINCDFEKMYGSNFQLLNTIKPISIFMAEGSDVSINWKRHSISK